MGGHMNAVKERFLVDEAGNRVAVVVSLEDYRQLVADVADVEELDGIRAYDAAKASGETAIPFDQAVAELERPPR